MSTSIKEFLDEWEERMVHDVLPLPPEDREEFTRQFQEQYGITLPPDVLLTGIQVASGCAYPDRDSNTLDLTISYGCTSPPDPGQEQAAGLELPSVADLRWSEERQPDDSCWYNHVVADTPFGRFRITWKGWKDGDCPTIDETPWNEFGGAFSTVAEAKAAAQAQFAERILSCFGNHRRNAMKLTVNTKMAPAPAPAPVGTGAAQPKDGTFSAHISGKVCTFAAGAETFTAKMPFGLRGFNIAAEVLIDQHKVMLTGINGRKESPPIQLTDVERVIVGPTQAIDWPPKPHPHTTRK